MKAIRWLAISLLSSVAYCQKAEAPAFNVRAYVLDYLNGTYATFMGTGPWTIMHTWDSPGKYIVVSRDGTVTLPPGMSKDDAILILAADKLSSDMVLGSQVNQDLADLHIRQAVPHTKPRKPIAARKEK